VTKFLKKKLLIAEEALFAAFSGGKRSLCTISIGFISADT